MIILDFGSGNTCQNDISTVMEMIDGLAKVDKNRQAIIKWQLFRKTKDQVNTPLSQNIFDCAYYYAKDKGFMTTASVFDEISLKFLLKYKIPFVKIANQTALYQLIEKVPDDIKVVASFSRALLKRSAFPKRVKLLSCVSKYPSSVLDYESEFKPYDLNRGLSDHTASWYLYTNYRPAIYECHYKLKTSKGLDAGIFARTPEQLKELLNGHA